MFNTGYPTARFSWKDVSGANTDTLIAPATEGLNVPFFFMLAERGTPGAIYFGGGGELNKLLGQSTFDPLSPYYNNATLFAGTAMAGQGIEAMRLVDPAATIATMGLFLTVSNEDVVQYKKDASGARIVDGSGNPVPRLNADNVTKVTRPGLKIKWSVRQLDADEDHNRLRPVTTQVGGVTTTTYPIMGFRVSSQGLYGNRQGFMLYSSNNENSAVQQAIGSVLYKFVPMELATNVSTTANTIADLFGATTQDVSFKQTAIYGPTNTNYAFNYVLNNSYIDAASGESALPFDVVSYGDNVAAIGRAAIAVSPELADLDPYLIDLISGLDGNGNEYDTIDIDDASSAVVNSSVVNFAQGGTDGDTSWTMLESLVANWLASGDHGEFSNLQQHPMTHYSDPGFSLSTKTLMFNMLSLRDNFKVDVSTQDISLPLNTKAEDLSVAQVLLFRAQMHPESVINGVPCTRVGIYAHAGELVSGSPLGGMVPFTFNRMVQRRDLDGGLYIKGSAGGFPNSQVTRFRRSNWVADDTTSQALSWGGCVNVVRHASRTTIFYPSLRTVYSNDTSLLSDDEFSDRILYIMKICRGIWAKYAGIRKPAQTLFPRIKRDIDNACASAFSGDDISVVSNVFQTANDANLGYQISVNLAITGTLPMRTMNFNVIVGRSPVITTS